MCKTAPQRIGGPTWRRFPGAREDDPLKRIREEVVERDRGRMCSIFSEAVDPPARRPNKAFLDAPRKLFCVHRWMLVKKGKCTLKGGFVYFALFRRPLLAALYEVWRFMERLKALPPVVRLSVPTEVQRELLTFILLTPLAQIDFRCPFVEHVTCSDASTTGGGICVSEGLTSYGVAALNSESRGDLPKEGEIMELLTVGLFDGLGALRLAVDSLGVAVAGHLSVEKEGTGRRAVEAFFPDSIFHEDVKSVDETLVKSLSLRFPSVSLVLIGVGPPCQGVSGLNAAKKGALQR